MRHFRYFAFALMTTALLGVSAFGQETQTRVVDEVVAQVNDGVITLSRIKREMKNAVDSFVQDGKTREEAQRLVDEKQGELIANLINEELLIQKAKESGLENEIEASINQRMAEIMKENKLKTVDELYKEMEKQGVNPQELKDNWRKQATRDRVIAREVQAKIYWGFTGKDLKDYYEKNKSKFTKPETVSFSELFLGFAGRDEKAVKYKGYQLFNDLKAGGDWDKLVKENSDPGLVTQGTGKAEKLVVKDLVDTIGKPLNGVKVKDYTAPIEIDQMGVVILRVDDREKASDESVFDESAVRAAMTGEKFPTEQKKFMAKLRENAYIKINDTYRPIVSPILFEDERKTATGKTTTGKTEK